MKSSVIVPIRRLSNIRAGRIANKGQSKILLVHHCNRSIDMIVPSMNRSAFADFTTRRHRLREGGDGEIYG